MSLVQTPRRLRPIRDEAAVASFIAHHFIIILFEVIYKSFGGFRKQKMC
jgi:hypothetical protein